MCLHAFNIVCLHVYNIAPRTFAFALLRAGPVVLFTGEPLRKCKPVLLIESIKVRACRSTNRDKNMFCQFASCECKLKKRAFHPIRPTQLVLVQPPLNMFLIDRLSDGFTLRICGCSESRVISPGLLLM